MPPWLTRRRLAVGGALAGVLAVGLSSFGPFVRAQAAREAVRRHVDVRIGRVRPLLMGARLLDVSVRPEGVDGIETQADEIQIRLGWTLRVTRIDVTGARVILSGSEEKLRNGWKKWRGQRSGGATRSAQMFPVSVHGMLLRWEDGQSAEPRVEARGIDMTYGSKGTLVVVSQALAREGVWVFSLDNAAVDLDSAGTLQSARAASLVVQSVAPGDPAPESRSGPRDDRTARATAPGGASPIGPARTSKRARAASPPPSPPLTTFPDLHALRSRIAIGSTMLAERTASGANLNVEALTWKITRPREQTALTIGPGPLSVDRSDSRAQVRFSTDPDTANTPLALSAVLPTDGTDPEITLGGGPIPLLSLGIRDGAAGLADVAHATLSGRARVVLAADGSALTFDGEVGTVGLSIENERLATDIVRGISLGLRARGALTADGELRVDDFAIALGSLRMAVAGELKQTPEYAAGAVRFDFPSTPCQALLDSLPSALLPTVQGIRIAGALQAHGHVAFDTRSLDDLELDYEVQDGCRIVDVAPSLARERFERQFSHRVYLPDGAVADETTGPGTPNWTPLEDISPYMQVAVLTTEDGAFFHHHGFNRASIRASIIADLKGQRFLRGASTITMQLAKNLFLSREKTLSRKLEEVVLTEYLEQTFSKDELMELYLNVIEFGPAVYGVTAAAEHYFGREPNQLNLAECLFLSSLLPAPLRYGAMRDNDSHEVPESWMQTLHSLMEVAHKLGRISDAELAEAKAQPVVFWNGIDRPSVRPPVPARTHLGGDSKDEGALPEPEGGDDSP
jgi:hypothetical protein